MRPIGFRLVQLMEKALKQLINDGEVSRSAWKQIKRVRAEIKIIGMEINGHDVPERIALGGKKK